MTIIPQVEQACLHGATIEYPGAYYHVINRGLSQRDIFVADKDREGFLALLGEIARQGLEKSSSVSSACLRMKRRVEGDGRPARKARQIERFLLKSQERTRRVEGKGIKKFVLAGKALPLDHRLRMGDPFGEPFGQDPIARLCQVSNHSPYSFLMTPAMSNPLVEPALMPIRWHGSGGKEL